ncbi:aromatic-ring-hydroxylating dioxygenase subunit beta [Peribacillus sp. NPDC046944]|uniref:aromatic-ring-hydroxylating dioxygenase subunit beta n=1 Tax=unclassified Peribacillus TaxID=2675266 RepID=UPI003CFCC51E
MNVDSSKFSNYMDNDYYNQLIDHLKDWELDVGVADDGITREIEKFLYQEARLLDEGKLEDWLNLFSSECLYWIPSIPGGGNPKKQVSIAFDDRRRLEDRVYRLRTGYAWSQIPSSRTIRLQSNIEVWKESNQKDLRARTNFLVSEFRNGKQKSYAGWNGYRLVQENNQWKIAVKQVNLIDCDQGHENMTFIL